jgi:hypothetical protein
MLHSQHRTEEEIGHLQKITSPHPCRMITQECFPILSTGSFGANLLHVLLDGSFAHPNIQLEEFPMDTLRSPKPIICCHLLDQANRLKRKPQLS